MAKSISITILLTTIIFTSFVFQCYASGDKYIAAVIGLKAEKYLTKPDLTLYLIADHYRTLVTYLMQNTSKVPDIIVFPEKGLVGENEPYSIDIPSTEDFVIPCLYPNQYPVALKSLSCTAREMKVYLVVNLVESHFNISSNRTMRFNTDVAFNRQGAIVARYRKFNLNEPGYDTPGRLEPSFFQTDFGVIFGLFTGYDILFKEPINTLVEKYKIAHFVHPTRWYNELPYLTGIQIQSGWAYSTNSILLSAGYNDPLQGNSGTGIYQGQNGPIEYSQPEGSKAFAIVSEVPKDPNQPRNNAMKGMIPNIKTNVTKPLIVQLEKVITQPSLLLEMTIEEMEEKIWNKHSPSRSKSMKSIVFRSSLRLKRDNIDAYKTKLIDTESIRPGIVNSNFDLMKNITVHNITTETNINETICVGKKTIFCCRFEIEVKSYYVLNLTTSDYIVSGDNYTNYYYRMAVFDGDKDFSSNDNLVSGTVQTCGIIPCLNKTTNSCSIRTDNYDSEPPTIASPATIQYNGNIYTKTVTTFNFIKINTEIRGKDSDIYPIILQKSQTTDEFGSLPNPSIFVFYKEDKNNTNNQIVTLKTNNPINNLGSIGVYARVYQPQSSSTINDISKILLILPFYIIYNVIF